jgi:hypothetical protein
MGNIEVYWSDAGALDLAILQMLEPPHDLQPLELNTSALHVGQSCYVAGHALFRPSCTATPMLTAGNVSKVMNCSYVK